MSSLQFLLFFCTINILLLLSIVRGLPITSEPLESNPDHLTWEGWFQQIESNGKTKKITPKSIFITPNFTNNLSLPVVCPKGYKVNHKGQCIQIVSINQADILVSRLQSILSNANTNFDNGDSSYDYDDDADDHHSNDAYDSAGPFQVNLPLLEFDETTSMPSTSPLPISLAPPLPLTTDYLIQNIESNNQIKRKENAHLQVEPIAESAPIQSNNTDEIFVMEGTQMVNHTLQKNSTSINSLAATGGESKAPPLDLGVNLTIASEDNTTETATTALPPSTLSDIPESTITDSDGTAATETYSTNIDFINDDSDAMLMTTDTFDDINDDGTYDDDDKSIDDAVFTTETGNYETTTIEPFLEEVPQNETDASQLNRMQGRDAVAVAGQMPVEAGNTSDPVMGSSPEQMKSTNDIKTNSVSLFLLDHPSASSSSSPPISAATAAAVAQTTLRTNTTGEAHPPAEKGNKYIYQRVNDTVPTSTIAQLPPVVTLSPPDTVQPIGVLPEGAQMKITATETPKTSATTLKPFWWLPSGWEVEQTEKRPLLLRFWSRMPLVRDSSLNWKKTANGAASNSNPTPYAGSTASTSSSGVIGGRESFYKEVSAEELFKMIETMNSQDN